MTQTQEVKETTKVNIGDTIHEENVGEQERQQIENDEIVLKNMILMRLKLMLTVQRTWRT